MSNYNNKLQLNNNELQAILDDINNLPDAGSGGLDTSDATATSADILKSKTAYAKGAKVTGTIETKTSSDLTASGATVTVPAGYYASQATKSIDTVTQASPALSINSNGKITASATQSAGYVAAGTKSSTLELMTEAAKTVTPTKSEQIAVLAGVYTTGAVKVAAIPSEYITTSDATAEASEIFAGETAYTANGKITGTFTIQEEITEQDSLIAQLSSILDGKASGGSSTEPILQNKTVTPSEDSQIVTADDGYDGLNTVIVSAIPDIYVKPTNKKAATIYTPGTSNQTIAAGTYCSGVQTIQGDANLIASNIKAGVSIFGVTGSAEAGGGTGGSPIVSVTIIDSGSMDGAYYFDENSIIQHVVLSTQTVNALNGIVFTRTPMDIISPDGNCISSSQSSLHAVRFLEDGGTATITMT